MLSLFICTTPRSGSYLLSDLLAQIGLPFAEELFTPFHENVIRNEVEVDGSFSYVDFLEKLSTDYRINENFTVKLMLSELENVLTQLKKETDETSAFQILLNSFPTPKFILLVRENSYAQAVSYTKAQQTGKWIKKSSQEDPGKIHPYYSYLQIEYSRQKIQQMNLKWLKLFERMGIDPIKLSYEGLVKDPEYELNRVLSLIFEDNCAESVSLKESRFIPMKTAMNSDWIERYEKDRKSANENGVIKDDILLDKLEIKNLVIEDEYVRGERPMCSLEIINKGEPFCPIGHSDGNGWLTLNVAIAHSYERYTHISYHEVHQKAEDRRCFKVDPMLFFPLPPNAIYEGMYKISLRLSFQRLTYEEVSAAPSFTKVVRLRPTQNEIALENFLGPTKLNTDGWSVIPWLGKFMGNAFPWVYHSEHKWLYFNTKKGGPPYQVLDRMIGWLEIDPAAYPDVKIMKTGEIIKFDSVKFGMRKFIAKDTGEILNYRSNSKSLD